MDLYISLYKRTNNKLDDYSNLQYVEELCYARKFWGLWYELNHCPMANQDEYEVVLTLEAWDALMDKIEPIYETLLEVRDIYNKYGWQGTNVSGFPVELKIPVEIYELWYDETFDGYTRLGYDFDANILINWYEAKDRVREYLQDIRYVVVVINSF